jgi:hypothetical protein
MYCCIDDRMEDDNIMKIRLAKSVCVKLNINVGHGTTRL